jgi:hypothetical protein
MSISQNFPEEGPTLNLNFAGSRTLDPRITFTRTSSATYMGRDGLVKIAPANSARFDHRYNSTTGEVESLGLLVEEARSNLIINSEAVSTWTIINMIPTGNSVLLPNGVASTGVEYRGETEDPTGKLLRPGPTGGIVAGETFVFSIFLRYGTEPTVHIVLQDNVAGQSTGRTFNLQTGVWTTNQSFNGGTSGSSGFDIYPNGWYRVWLSCTFPNSNAGVQTFVRLRGNLGEVPATTSFSAWGANLEKGAFPTSYIPTGSSTATRTADNASITGSNFTKWYNQSEGTFLINGRTDNPSFQRSYGVSVFNIDEISVPNRLSIRMGNTFMLTGGVNQFGYFQEPAAGIPYKISVAFKTNSALQVLNGVASGGEDTTVTPPTNLNIMEIGKVEATANLNINGHIAQLTYYPQRLQNSQLITLTK